MNMMQMLGIVLFFYFVSLTLICFYRDKINVKFWNMVFVIVDVIVFFCWNIAAYSSGWLDDRFMTLDNISPLMFTVIPLTYFMKDSIRQAAFATIACLSFGMFAAMLISPEHAYLFSFYIEADFLYTSEAVCHMICSLFGLYLMQTGQVKANFKTWWKAMAFMFSIITFGVALNIIFHKDFFGMDPYGDYRIYMIDIFGSFGATLAAYYLGVLVVLTLGLHTGQLLEKLTRKREKLQKTICAPSIDLNEMLALAETEKLPALVESEKSPMVDTGKSLSVAEENNFSGLENSENS